MRDNNTAAREWVRIFCKQNCPQKSVIAPFLMPNFIQISRKYVSYVKYIAVNVYNKGYLVYFYDFVALFTSLSETEMLLLWQPPRRSFRPAP